MKQIALTLTLLAALISRVHATVPVCGPECCNIPCEADLLVYECEGTSEPHFVLGDDTGLTRAKGAAASFTVDGESGITTIGNAIIPFTIGTSESRVRYTTSAGGECVGIDGVSYPSGLPSPIVVQNRAVNLSKARVFYCREPGRDLICFAVKGQVGAPFPPLSCTPDRVEDACGVVGP